MERFSTRLYRRRGPLRLPSLSVTTASLEVPIYFYAGAYYALIYLQARIIYVYLYLRNAAQTGCLPPTRPIRYRTKQ